MRKEKRSTKATPRRAKSWSTSAEEGIQGPYRSQRAGFALEYFNLVVWLPVTEDYYSCSMSSRKRKAHNELEQKQDWTLTQSCWCLPLWMKLPVFKVSPLKTSCMTEKKGFSGLVLYHTLYHPVVSTECLQHAASVTVPQHQLSGLQMQILILPLNNKI